MFLPSLLYHICDSVGLFSDDILPTVRQQQQKETKCNLCWKNCIQMVFSVPTVCISILESFAHDIKKSKWKNISLWLRNTHTRSCYDPVFRCESHRFKVASGNDVSCQIRWRILAEEFKFGRKVKNFIRNCEYCYCLAYSYIFEKFYVHGRTIRLA